MGRRKILLRPPEGVAPIYSSSIRISSCTASAQGERETTKNHDQGGVESIPRILFSQLHEEAAIGSRHQHEPTLDETEEETSSDQHLLSSRQNEVLFVVEGKSELEEESRWSTNEISSADYLVLFG
jgi:hypothetical protein